jgi:hypothetical protein
MKEGVGQRQIVPLIRYRFTATGEPANERWSFPEAMRKTLFTPAAIDPMIRTGSRA